MKKVITTSFILIFSFLFVNILISSSKGKTGYTKKGCICHGKLSAGNSTIQLKSTPNIFDKKGFNPDSTYQIIISLKGETKTKNGGFNLKVSHGKLTKDSRFTKIMGQEATHANNRKTEWVLNWTAPNTSVDTVTFFYTGCLANGNYKKSGDDPTVPQTLIAHKAK
ncbi:hypothetical protein H8E88_25065 [candidate division KSB1 bacterium]|nr:hypothetical protein [candidate division KSB1 bacterium]MBL7092464.1 hypothetical protein [candidate division KSB1 bacterium]